MHRKSAGRCWKVEMVENWRKDQKVNILSGRHCCWLVDGEWNRGSCIYNLKLKLPISPKPKIMSNLERGGGEKVGK